MSVVSLVKVLWSVGSNRMGYLPDSPESTFVTSNWQEALERFRSDLENYADTLPECECEPDPFGQLGQTCTYCQEAAYVASYLHDLVTDARFIGRVKPALQFRSDLPDHGHSPLVFWLQAA